MIFFDVRASRLCFPTRDKGWPVNRILAGLGAQGLDHPTNELILACPTVVRTL